MDTTSDGLQNAVVRRLSEIRARLSSDLTLQQFLRVVDNSDATLPLTLTILVGGHLLRGSLLSRRQFSKYLDESVEATVTEALEYVASQAETDDSVTENIETLQRYFSHGPFEGFTRQRNERDTRMLGVLADLRSSGSSDTPADVLNIPTEHVADYVQSASQRTGFSLSDAELQMSGQGWVKVGTVRVVVAQVAAWWLGDSNPKVNSEQDDVT